VVKIIDITWPAENVLIDKPQFLQNLGRQDVVAITESSKCQVGQTAGQPNITQPSRVGYGLARKH
jgi:hypothetical protein